MQYRKTETGYILRLLHGEALPETILAFAKEKGVRGATFTILGAVVDPELGFYHLETRAYSWKRFSGDFEIASGVGNIALVDDEPFLHLHVAISDEEFRAYGGHLKNGKAGATCEVALTVFSEPLVREMDDAVGLRLWRLDP